MRVKSNMADPLRGVDDAALAIVQMRKRPLLLLYYLDTGGEMREDDIEDLYLEVRARGWDGEKRAGELDVLIHTMGGSPEAAYRMAQLLRNVSENVTFLVPEHACSAGTLTCLCGDMIRLGPYAILSPFDITIPTDTEESVELASVDYYMNFAIESRRQVGKMLKDGGFDGETDVDSRLLAELVSQVGALDIGRFFRERKITTYYAEKLLADYMFSTLAKKDVLSQSVAQRMVHEYPSHDFAMDFHICKDLGLVVEEMTTEESDKTHSLLEALGEASRLGIICKEIKGDFMEPEVAYRMPYFRLYGFGGEEIGEPTKQEETTA